MVLISNTENKWQWIWNIMSRHCKGSSLASVRHHAIIHRYCKKTWSNYSQSLCFTTSTERTLMGERVIRFTCEMTIKTVIECSRLTTQHRLWVQTTASCKSVLPVLTGLQQIIARSSDCVACLILVNCKPATFQPSTNIAHIARFQTISDYDVPIHASSITTVDVIQHFGMILDSHLTKLAHLSSALLPAPATSYHAIFVRWGCPCVHLIIPGLP